MSSFDRAEELLSVQSIYCDEFNTFEALSDTHFRFRSVPIVLSITLPLSYPDPAHLPDITVNSDGIGVSMMQMSQLRTQLETIIQSKPNEPILFELTEETREFTEQLRGDVEMCLDEEEDEEDEKYWEDYHINESDRRVVDHTTAQSHMGTHTLEGIVSQLPSHTRLLHAEIVLRTDLRVRFQAMRRTIQHEATRGIQDRRTKDAIWDRVGQEDIVFHGTLRRHVASIVRSGFIVPGQKTVKGETVEVRCGSTWGQGIYTSPDPDYSLSYTDYTPEGETGLKGRRRLLPGQKLIVCAILMGRRCYLSPTRRLDPTVAYGFNSHISPNRLEYIVFNSAQVLPLYVLHLGDAKASALSHPSAGLSLPSHSASEAGETLQEARDRLTEYARKHLPGGFGAASGHRFVVEAIAPVDDDEEVWGEFQHDVVEQSEFQEERWVYRWMNR